MAYDYRETVKADVKEWLADNFEYLKDSVNVEDKDDVREFLNDTLWAEDSVTGNSSGSYTFSRAEAEKCVMDNLDLAIEALREFGYTNHAEQLIIEQYDGEFDEDWEYLDVSIRCYLLGEIIEEVIDEEKAFNV